MADTTGEGARIRALRLETGIAQADLARQAGISPSYLNLIEHGRRPIGGRVLARLAEALGADAAALSRGAEVALIEDMRRAAGRAGDGDAVAPEIGRVEAMAAAYPGWSALIAAQADRIATLERGIATLGDRLSHDPLLSASVHDVLSTVTAIQSTSAILAEDAALPADWQARFHRNLHEDSLRLANSARRLASYLDAGTGPEHDVQTPQDEMEAWLTHRAFHVAELETGSSAPEDLAGTLPDGPDRAVLLQHLRDYARDAAQLPLDTLRDALQRTGAPDPFRVAVVADVPLPLAMRRLASAPEDVVGTPLGLAVCDGAGALTLRRPLTGFEIPRFGAGCPLWPLFEALWSPRPVACALIQPGRATRPVQAFAAAERTQPRDPSEPVVLRATMLIVPAEAGANATDSPRPVGQSCRLCPREGCPARREPSILPDAEG